VPEAHHRLKKTYFGPHDPYVHCHDDTYNRLDKPGYCGVCGKRTNYKSLYAAEYCCSVECSNELWCDITERIASRQTTNRKRNGK
jgi:hypothetical protein